MLKRFQQMGHQIIFVVGDFTARIGDPSGRLTARPILTEEQVRENMKTYLEQVSLILDLEKIKVVYNSEWLSKMTMNDWLPLLQKVNASQLFAREDFQKRLKAGGSISMAELMYALFMAYDSLVIKPDIEIGGIDQMLNLYWCRNLMDLTGTKGEVVDGSEIFIVTDLLVGTTGEIDSEGRMVKMSKSLGNYISVTERPDEMYGKIMSISDEVMWVWFRELTEISSNELEDLKRKVQDNQIHPMQVKRMLARVIVGTLYRGDRKVVEMAERRFEQKFGKQKVLIPEDIVVEQVNSDYRLIDELSRIIGEYKSYLRRTAESGGIWVLRGEGYVNLTIDELLKPIKELAGEEKEIIIKIGKRRYYKLILS